MKIRFSSYHDVDTIVRFNIGLAKESENKDLNPDTVQAGVRELLNDRKKGFYLIAEDGGRSVGQLMITTEWSDWRNGSFWWIQSVYIIKECRNKGIYRSLHNHVRELARKAGNVCGIRLYVDQDNQLAQIVYSKMGMKENNYTFFEEEWE